MTLEEVKKIAYQKIFQNDEPLLDISIEDLKQEEDNAVYFENMIPAINEAIQDLDKYQKNVEKIDIDKTYIDTKNNGSNTIDTEKIKNYKALVEVYKNGALTKDYEVIANRYIKLSITENDVYEVFYRTNPIIITKDTPEDTVLKIKDEILVLIPLYIASEILKDENISLATVYRNQYEAGKEMLEELTLINKKINTVLTIE